MDVKKLQRAPSFTFFGTVTLFKNLILKNFSGNFSCPQRLPFNFFFHFFATSWSFAKPEGSPSPILSLRYGADFGHSRLVSTSLCISRRNLCCIILKPSSSSKRNVKENFLVRSLILYVITSLFVLPTVDFPLAAFLGGLNTFTHSCSNVS